MLRFGASFGAEPALPETLLFTLGRPGTEKGKIMFPRQLILTAKWRTVCKSKNRKEGLLEEL